MTRIARLLALVCPVVVVFGLAKVHAAWVADPPYDFTGSSRFGWSVLYAALLVLAGYGAGLPDLGRSWRSTAAASLMASAAAAGPVSLVQLMVGDALLPRFVVLGAPLVLLPLHLVLGAMSRSGQTRAGQRDRVVLVGSRPDADLLETDIKMVPERPAVLVASMDVADAARSEAAGGVNRPLLDVVRETQATVVVLDRDAYLDASVVSQAAALHEAGARVRSLAGFYEEWLAKLPVGELERASLFFDISDLHSRRYGRLKRMCDVAGALVGLVPLVLLTPVVWAGNLAGNRGPLFFRQERIGFGGKPFQIVKFRTMKPDDGASHEWTAVDDPRVTKFGRFLRASHIDELPQMLNILRGELSLVGPRPEQPHYVRELSAKLPFYRMRHLVRPGLTGWAQVKYGYAGDERDALEKLQYEFFYLRHQSLRFDSRVLVRTVRSVVGLEGKAR